MDQLRKIPFIDDMLTPESFAQFKRYFITGVLSFTIEYALFRLLNDVLKLWYIWANSIVLSIVFWFNFLMNRLWSFKSKGGIRRQLIQYLILFVFNFGATNALMYILSGLIGILPAVSKILVMGAVVSWNFIIYKKIIYKA